MSHKSKIRSSSSLSAEITTAISISLVLFLLGLTLFILIMGQEISNFIKENMSVSIELVDSDKNAVSKLQKKLNESPYINSITFISKEDIKKELIEELGGDPEEILGYTPASDYFDITLKSDYANLDSIKVVESSFKGHTLIKNFIYSEETLDIINSNLSKIGFGLTVLAVLLMVISFTLIRNTIRLNIYAKRFLINTMQLVGATDGFIRKPFVIKSVMSGIIAAVLANIGITALVYGLSKEFPEILFIISPENLLMLYGVVLLLGILLTYLATRFAVNRYLEMETNNLYYI